MATATKKKNKATKDSGKNSNTWFPFVYTLVALFALRWTVVEPYVVPTGSMEPTLKTGDRLFALKCAYDVRFPFTNFILFRTAAVKRGDIILFDSPPDPSITYVKRAVGLPGDKLEVRNGTLFVNGVEMAKNVHSSREVMQDIEDQDRKTLYIENLTGVKHYTILDGRNDRNDHKSPFEIFDGTITVPPDHYFAMGDNRDHSSDSRFWGFVPSQYLKGRAMFIWNSYWDSNPDIVDSMKSTHQNIFSRIGGFFYELLMLVPHLFNGEAWIRWDRIGTPVQ